MPVAEPTVATAVLVLVQVPPVGNDNAEVRPVHNEVVPEIVAVGVTTDTVVKRVQPLVAV